MRTRAAISTILSLITILLYAPHLFADAVEIRTAHHSSREQREKQELEQLLKRYDLSKYTFTNTVIIEERTMNHAFPVLTLNVHFLDSDDELLSSFLHEQLHWYLRDHPTQMEQALTELRRFYPKVPVGLPEGADTMYSTYGHLVDCYLEIQADRQLIGDERTTRVIKTKPWYTWIYKTITENENKIDAVVKGNHLDIQ